MSQTIPSGILPSAMEEKLMQISRRQAAISVLRAVAVGASVLFTTMMVAMLIDWQLTLFSTSVRTMLTMSSLLLSMAALLIGGLPSLIASLKRIQAAKNADTEIPQLEERWQTVVAVANSHRQPASATAKAMLQQVTSEAVAIGRIVQPRRVADVAALKSALMTLAACVVLLIGFLAIDWPQTSVLLRRFVAPTANISATSLACPTGDVMIARGETVDLVAEMTGLLRTSAILTTARSDSKPEATELSVDKKVANRFVHRTQADESFRYRVRAGDGQTEWYSVTVVDYPMLAEVRFTIIAPAYLNRPNVEKTIIPGRLKVMQGSLLQLQMRPKAALQRLELTVTPEVNAAEKSSATPQIYSVTADSEGWYRFVTQLNENLSISPQLWNSHGLTNEDRTVCRIQVIGDSAPVARVLTPTDEMSVAADDVVDIKFEAHDDHGITKAELVVYDESAAEDGKPAPVLKVLPIPLDDQRLAKQIIGTTQLDLKQLDLKPGTQVSYAVRVTDNRTVADERTTTSPRETQPTGTESANADANEKSTSREVEADPSSKETANRQTDEASKAASSNLAKHSDRDSDKDAARDASRSDDSPNDAEQGFANDATSTNPSDRAPKSPEKMPINPGRKLITRTAKDSKGDADSATSDDPTKAEGNPPESESDVADHGEDPNQQPSKNTDNRPPAKPRKRPVNDGGDIVANAPADPAVTSTDQADKEAGDTSKRKSPNGNSKAQNSAKKASNSKEDVEASKTEVSTDEPQGVEPTDGSLSDDKPTAERPTKSRAKPKLADSAADRQKAPGDTARTPQPQPIDASDSEHSQGDSTPGSESSQADDAPASTEGNEPKEGNDPKTSKSPDPINSNAGQPARVQSKKAGKSEELPPPPRMRSLSPQQSESGQNAETNRRILKIKERLSALAAARETRKTETSNVRDRVVEIDGMLAEAETGLTQVVNREIPDDDQSAHYKKLDTHLGKVESKISSLRKDTRDEQFAFVGLQMLDIGRSHVTPAREKVFIAIREPVSASSGHSRGALQKIVRARELLAALLTRYDRVARDLQLAEALKDGVKMYEVYVEKMQQLMREARQNQNPLDRAMAVIEVDQEYLDRYAEVLTMRREMLAEFGRILGDDPRLLARYFDLVKRRRSSLRDQLSELAKRQHETSNELSGWQAADEDQRGDLWNLAVELRMQASTQLAKDAAELSERMDKQFPLVLEATHPTSARVIALSREIAETSRAISLEARRQIREPTSNVDLRPKSRQLTQLFVELDAKLEQLSFENSKETEVTTYVSGRLLESRTVADQANMWRQTADHVHEKRFHGLTEVDQHRVAIATELLRVDLLGIETELSAQFQQLAERSIPEPIVARIRELQQLMEEITFEQTGAEFALSENRLVAAEKLLKQASDNFTEAEELFDRMRRAIVTDLDEMKVPNPTVADLEDPKLDEFLTQLEREPNIDAQLGIPDRPRNLRVIADSLTWQEEGGSQLGAMEEEARARVREEQKERKEEQNLGNSDKPESEPNAAEPTEEERQQQEQVRRTSAELAKAIEALKDRKKDPSADPDELKKLELAARELQEKFDQLQQGMDPNKLWHPMKEDLEKTLALLKETGNDPAEAMADLQRVELLTKDLHRLLDQMRKEPNPENRWKMVAEFERKKEILKAVARGERIPDEQWNKLLSTLDDGLWQVGGRSLPEEYRKAIEQYQEQIRKLTNSGREDVQ